MKSAICDMFGIEFPLMAFTHCRDVVVAVSKAGGMGVLGAATIPPQQLEEELRWIDDHIGGMPYGVDVIIPNNMQGKGTETTVEELIAAIPGEQKAFLARLLDAHRIDASDLSSEQDEAIQFSDNLREASSLELLEVSFSHPVKFIVNALGVPPRAMLDMGKQRGVMVGALAGAKEHAIHEVEAGVDVLIVAGGEAGGHCGDVSTMVLVPEVHQAIQPIRDVPILAAGGIVTGRQMAATMAMGAAGVWTGSVWLTTQEAETNPVVKEKMLQAGARDTVRSRSRTGKYTRQLRSSWTDAWASDEAPEPLPMPLQYLLASPAMHKVDKLAAGGHEGARSLISHYVGQGVGMMNQSLPATAVVHAFKEDFLEACERLNDTIAN